MVSMHPLRWGRAAQLVLVLLLLTRAPVVIAQPTPAGMGGAALGLVAAAIVVVGLGRHLVVSLGGLVGSARPQKE